MLIGVGVSELYSQARSTLIFLRINPAARNAALGDAGVALDDDVNSMFFNPATIARQYNPEDENSKQMEFTGSYAQWLPQFNFDDLYYLYWAGRYYMNNVGMFGLSIQYMNYGEIQRTGENQEDLGTFSSNETAVSFAYAYPVSQKWDLGVGVKYIYSNLANVAVGAQNEKGVASALGFDLGGLYHTSIMGKNTKIGVSLGNMGTNVKYIDEQQADPMPVVLRAGIASDIYTSEFHRVLFIYQLEREMTYRDSASADDFPKSLFTTWKNDNNLSLFSHSVGVEYWYSNLVALRTGYFYESPKNGDRQFLSLGMGLKYLSMRIDIAYLYSFTESSPLSETLRFSFSMGI